jgi:hypothetical protein
MNIEYRSGALRLGVWGYLTSDLRKTKLQTSRWNERASPFEGGRGDEHVKRNVNLLIFNVLYSTRCLSSPWPPSKGELRSRWWMIGCYV